MKRAIKAVTVAFFILMLLIIALVPLAMAQPTNIPHEDPSTTDDTFQAYSIFDAYSVIVGFLAVGDFDDASSALAEMAQVQLPETIRDAFDLYYSSIVDVSAQLELIVQLLDEADSLIASDLWAEANDKLDDANDKLDDANVHLEQVEIKIGDIRVVTEALTNTLNDFILDSDLFNSVYDRYTKIIDEVELLRITYANLRQELKEGIELDGLGTKITLDIVPQTVQVGEQLILSGRLTYAGGIRLPDMEVALVLGTTSPIGVPTDAQGDYTASIQVPYSYASTMVVKAAYSPKTAFDIQNYQATYSETNVDLSFNTTDLRLVDVPQRLLIGSPNIISGFVEGDGVWLSGRTVQLYLDKSLVNEGLTDGDGRFELPLIPPADYDLGNHTIKVIVEPHNSKKCSGAYESVDVRIYRAFPEVTVSTARYIMLSSSMVVSGKAIYEGEPVVDAEVIVNFVGTRTATTTDDDGQYSVDVSLSPSSIVMGSQEVSVSVVPADAWLGSMTVRSEVLAFSLLNMSFVSAAVVALGVVVYRSRKRLALELAEAKGPLDLPQESDLWDSFTPSGNKVLNIYHDAVLIVGQLTGTQFEANATLREYLLRCNLRQGGIRKVFALLTYLAEVALYSEASPEGSSDEAQKLYDRLRQELISEPS
ncbi:MAG: hypothetical protein HN929_00640 [Chloroflexi bacterium]|jgi:hypothetical protein|nr:hypothetical protein [Chloroflexota bacterium]MBT7079973.1 hypothetical protein [Chloroflexota bacterium]MBT7289497.1 hypothetical protein [Chloroflexota bacterium]